jgi:hypothetical protein
VIAESTPTLHMIRDAVELPAPLGLPDAPTKFESVMKPTAAMNVTTSNAFLATRIPLLTLLGCSSGNLSGTRPLVVDRGSELASTRGWKSS